MWPEVGIRVCSFRASKSHRSSFEYSDGRFPGGGSCGAKLCSCLSRLRSQLCSQLHTKLRTQPCNQLFSWVLVALRVFDNFLNRVARQALALQSGCQWLGRFVFAHRLDSPRFCWMSEPTTSRKSVHLSILSFIDLPFFWYSPCSLSGSTRRKIVKRVGHEHKARHSLPQWNNGRS